MPLPTNESDDETKIYYSGNGGVRGKNAENILPAPRVMLSFYHILFKVNDSAIRAQDLLDHVKK